VSNWPLLLPNTYYWVAVTPTTPLPLPNGQFNGATWGGIDDTTNPLRPASLQSDPNLFKGRQLTSECVANDTTFSANLAGAVPIVRDSDNWPSVSCSSARFTNWAALGSKIRYGVQILGPQVPVSPSPTPSPAPPSASRSASRTPTGTNTPFPTTISTSRFIIDRFNLTFARVSDQPGASVGAIDPYNNNVGSLISTAVLIKSADNLPGDPVDWLYRPTRVDLLMYWKTAQPTRPSGISDFYVTLYSDDNTTEHNPGVQVSGGSASAVSNMKNDSGHLLMC
jgi:hypothetical protein